jgi:hypothetical protein
MMAINSCNPIFLFIFWTCAGAVTGIILGWWQWVSLKKLGKKNTDELISNIYVILAIRVLIVSGILFAAFLQGLRFGLSFLLAFLISRWIWIYKTINQNKDNKE